MHKVFGVGLGRTGTSTLSWMLRILGWNTTHYLLDPMQYGRFDAVTDVPTYVYLMSTDIRYPDSKYILTTRDVDSWLESWKSWTGSNRVFGNEEMCRMVSYGCTSYDEDRLRKIHVRHSSFIEWYFQNYGSDRLLKLPLCDKSVSDSEKWNLLCGFLNVGNPDIVIPHFNKRSQED